MPRLLVPGGATRSYPKSYSSVLGLAVDNLVKWLVYSQTRRAVSFDAVGESVRIQPVRHRLLYPRHLRRAGRWLDRLGIPPWSEDGEPSVRPDREEIARRRSDWEQQWSAEVARGIVVPLIDGQLAKVADDALARFLTDFIWSPRLRDAPSDLREAVGALREILSRVDIRQLRAQHALIDPNFGFDSGAHYLLTALEADLVLDATLIDIKLTSSADVPRRIFEDMIRYYLCFALHTFSEGEGAQTLLWRRIPPRIEVERIGLFIADRAELVVWDRRAWISDAQLGELRRMYKDGTWIHAERHQPRSTSQLPLFESPRRPRKTRRVAAPEGTEE